MSNDDQKDRRSEEGDSSSSRENDHLSDPLSPKYRAEMIPDARFESRGRARRNTTGKRDPRPDDADEAWKKSDRG